MTLADAIAKLEGVNPAYNNPGAISGTGDTGTSFGAGIGIYSTPAVGKQALQQQIDSIYSGTSKYYSPETSIADFDRIYSGGARDGSQLASMLGVTPSTPLSKIPNDPYLTKSDGILTSILRGIDEWGGGVTSNDPLAIQKKLLGNRSFQDYLVIIVGLLLIAAGLFAFKQTQTIIQTGGKLAKKGVEFASA